MATMPLYGKNKICLNNKPKFTLTYFNIIKEINQVSAVGPLVKNYYSYISTKTYVVGFQKSRLHKTVLLSTQNTCLN